MVDIRQLTIGSHVSVDGRRVRVFGIGSNAIAYLPNIVSSVCKEAKAEEIEPILLTPALLEELGFAWKDEGCWQHWWKGGFDLTRRGESSYWDYEGDLSVQYLHELESLYYLIYQEELIKD